MPNRGLSFGALAVVALAGACSAGSRTGSDSGAPDDLVRADNSTPVQITVFNENFYDANVYAVLQGQRRRLGTVTGNTTQTYSFPWAPGDVYIIVDFVSESGFRTEGLSVDPGDHLELRVTAQSHRIRGRGGAGG